MPHTAASASIPPAQSILDALPTAIALLGAKGTIVAVNQGWRAFAKSNGADIAHDFIGSNYLETCDRVSGIEGASAHAAAAGIRAVLAAEREFALDYPCHSIEKRWFQLRVSRLEHEAAIFAVVAHHNITDRVLAEQERQALLAQAQRTAHRHGLLVRELHHRVRNALATVQALFGATARSSRSVEEFYRSFSARIVSLARTQTLLTDDYWQTAPLHAMLAQELRPFLEAEEQRSVLRGPPIELSADLAVPVGMAIHELAANAVAHGALSVGTGWIEVTWDMREVDGSRLFHLAWVEHDGPPVDHPRHPGFGSTMLERALPMQTNGTATVTYDPSGLRFEMTAPWIEQRLVPEY